VKGQPPLWGSALAGWRCSCCSVGCTLCCAVCGVLLQVMQGRPTGVVAACKDLDLGREVQELFASPP